MGVQAGIHLDLLLRGERRILPKPLLLAPLRVIVRQSSDLSAIPDADVARACGFIREQAHRRLSVSDVAKSARIGRRTLERRFRTVLGRGLAEEIRRCHVERAKGLLGDANLTIVTVASRAGFGSAKQFAVAFRVVTGMTPRMFRQRR